MNQHQTIPSNNSSDSVRRCFKAVTKHFHVVILSSLLIAILGIVCVSLLPDVYCATTTILVDPQKIPERYVASTVTSDPNARMTTLTQLVLSPSRLQEIIDRNQLYPELRKRKTRDEIIEYVRQKTKIDLKVAPPPEQGLSSFSISYVDEDRWLVADIANQLAASFIDWTLKARQQQAIGTTEFLSTRLEEARQSLARQEGQLEAFRLRHAGATPDQTNANLQTMSRLQGEAQTNADMIGRLDQERLLINQLKATDPRDTAPITERDILLQQKRRSEADLWSLKRQFTDTYPDVIAAKEQLNGINAQLAKMPDASREPGGSSDPNTRVRVALIDKEIERYRQQRAALIQDIHSYQEKVDSVPVLEAQLADLTRNYEVSRQNYQALLDKTFSAGMSEQLERAQQGKRFTVLDPARTPEKPIRPNRLLLMAGVLVLAILMPSGVAIGHQVLGGAITSEIELKRLLPPKVQVLSTIPPIVSRTDLRYRRKVAVRTIIMSLAACMALIIFLLKVRPIL